MRNRKKKTQSTGNRPTEAFQKTSVNNDRHIIDKSDRSKIRMKSTEPHAVADCVPFPLSKTMTCTSLEQS